MGATGIGALHPVDQVGILAAELCAGADQQGGDEDDVGPNVVGESPMRLDADTGAGGQRAET
jgi:hypothetical protein